MTIYLGEFGELVLLAVRKTGKGAYGAPVFERLKKAMGPDRTLAYGAFYNTLQRLKAKGYLNMKFSKPSKKRGGRRKSILNVTRKGSQALQSTERTRKRLR